MSSKKKQLGKGIRALLENMENEPAEQRKALFKELSSTVTEIPVAWIEINPYQPRSEFDPEALEGLKQSILTHGIIQPLTVRRMSGEAYQLISGERRLRAAKLAGLEAVPAYVRIADDQNMLEMALVENIQREDLNALEVSISMRRLISECALTHEELSTRLGKDRSTVTNYLRLLKLPPVVQEAIRSRQLSMGHARALAGIEDLGKQLRIFDETMRKKLSVRALESLIRAYHNRATTKTSGPVEVDPEIKRIQDDLSAIFGSRVSLKRKSTGAGQIVIHFKSDRNLNQILTLLEELED